VAAGFAMSHWAQRLAAARDAHEPARPWRALVAVAATLVVVALGYSLEQTERWRLARDLPEAARQIRETVGRGTRVIVIGEAALAFYLELEGVPALRGYEYWETVVAEKQPVYVVTGIYIQRAPTLRKNFALLRDRLALLGEYPFFPYDNRILEDFRGWSAVAYLRERRDDYMVRLYRYTPDPTGYVPELVKN
jgi:hypothetical protein